MRRALIPLVLMVAQWGSPSGALAARPASIYLDQSRVTVIASGGASVLIDRSPFRMSFRDPAGHPVLQELSSSVSNFPSVLPPSISVAPGDSGLLRQQTLYAPLAFLIGAHRSEQWGGGLWQGDELFGVQGGVQYSAQAVIAVRVHGHGVELTISTDDPTGRMLYVDVVPQGGTFRVEVTPSSTSGIIAMSDSFASGADEAFHGFGGRHNSTDQHGQAFYNWAEEENFPCATAQQPGTVGCDALNGQPDDTQLFPNGPTAAYDVQSLFVSSRGYGFLLRQPQLSYWRLSSDRPDAWQTEVAAPSLDFTVATGSLPQIVGRLTAISGRNVAPPEWALGPQTSRLVVPGDGEQPAVQQAITADDIAHLKSEHLPIQAYDLFGWPAILNQANGEQILERDIAQLHALGIHVLAYFPPFVDTPSASGYTRATDFSDAVSKGLVATTPAGAPFVFSEPNLGLGALIDFSNPAARMWWADRIRYALDLGFDGFMEDFGEQAQSEMQFHNGMDGAEMHNLYPLLYHRATRQILDDYLREHPARSLWFYTRSGYSAVGDQKGSAAYDNGNFPGDNNADWDAANGLQSAAPDMLNRAIGGATGYSTDIGGYNGSPDAELFTRWFEWATLSPYMRIHNGDSNGTSQPWSFDAATLRTYRHYARLREAAKPYLDALWRVFERTGVPLTRPLWLAFPHDARAATQQQEWMLGDDVLVAPVVIQGARTNGVYFPAGCWVDENTGKKYRGPRRATVPASLQTLPYFFACGTKPFS